MHKDGDGKLVFNRLELTEDRCRQSKANEMTVSRNMLQDLLNQSTKLSRIRILCEAWEQDDLTREILGIIREKL